MNNSNIYSEIQDSNNARFNENVLTEAERLADAVQASFRSGYDNFSNEEIVAEVTDLFPSE